MINVPHLKQAIFKGVLSPIVYHHHHALTEHSRVCDHVSCDPAGTLPCCEERSLEVSAGIFPLGQHTGGEESSAPNQDVGSYCHHTHTITYIEVHADDDQLINHQEAIAAWYNESVGYQLKSLSSLT